MKIYVLLFQKTKKLLKSAQNSIFESILKSGRIFEIFDFLAKFAHLREKGKKEQFFANPTRFQNALKNGVLGRF